MRQIQSQVVKVIVCKTTCKVRFSSNVDFQGIGVPDAHSIVNQQKIYQKNYHGSLGGVTDKSYDFFNMIWFQVFRHQNNHKWGAVWL